LKNLRLFICLLFGTFTFAQNKVDVYFDFNETKPNATSQKVLNDWIKNHPNAEIEQIVGYCDTVASKVYNKKLATERINSIEKILRSSKITIASTVKKISYGEEFENSMNQNENRRVTFFYTNNEESNSFSSNLISAEKGQYLELKGLNFYGGSDTILPQSLPLLDELLHVMKTNEPLKIEIHGHICCYSVDTGDISIKRAKAVYEYLISKGISKNRLSFKGFGSTKPLFPLPEKTEEERIANRRVEILILQK
jgi:outer membrane protein OmpA-like peptidoglycan-associated protein